MFSKVIAASVVCMVSAIPPPTDSDVFYSFAPKAPAQLGTPDNTCMAVHRSKLTTAPCSDTTHTMWSIIDTPVRGGFTYTFKSVHDPDLCIDIKNGGEFGVEKCQYQAIRQTLNFQPAVDDFGAVSSGMTVSAWTGRSNMCIMHNSHGHLSLEECATPESNPSAAWNVIFL